MADMITILNTIRDNASSSYNTRVPEATKTNIAEIQSAIVGTDDVEAANEFCSLLMNKVVKSVFISKMFTNPLKALKKGKKPLGDGIEEIYANFLKAEVYDPTGANLLSRKLPDVKVVYHRMNRQDQYPVTISREALTKAFKSYENLEIFMNGIIQSVYNSAELDEFLLMKELLKTAITKNAVKLVEVADPSTNATSFIKDVKKVSNLMQFPSSEFNGYLQVQSKDKQAITTFAKHPEQVLIIDTVTDVDISIDVLAAAFNMSVAEFNECKKIIVDTFPAIEGKNIHAMLVDEAFMQIYDDLFTMTKFHNPKGLYDNYYLNVWQTIAFSPLVNAVAFYSPKAA